MRRLCSELEYLYGSLCLRKSGHTLFITSTEKDFYLTDYPIGYDYMDDSDETFQHFKDFVRFNRIWRWSVREISLGSNITRTNINFRMIFPNLHTIYIDTNHTTVHNNQEILIKPHAADG